MDSQSPKRPADFDHGGAAKKPKLAGSAKMSFAERMMAKMGYNKGEGLGKDGSGIAAPIEVKLRPQGVGVGAVKERTEQAKAEARRQAERRGETYEDSSDEERRARKARKDAAKKARAAGFGPPGPTGPSRPKQKFRTATEIEAEEGLEVPNVFKSLVDMTGAQPKLLTSTAGLLSTQQMIPAAEAEALKIAKSAQRELEAFADAWRDLQQRRTYVDLQQQQARADTRRRQGEIAVAQELSDAVEAINLDVDALSLSSEDAAIQASTTAIAEKLAAISSKFGTRDGLEALAVAAIAPSFKAHMALWEPFDLHHTYSPSYFPAILGKVKAMLELDSKTLSGDEDSDDDYREIDRTKQATAYESLILTLWLPKIRSLVVNDWSPYGPEPMLSLLQEWKPILPTLVTDVIVNQFVVQKLSAALKTWKPAVKSKDSSASKPHVWLFPWLAHLDEYHLDARSSDGLLAEVKRKYRTAFDTWDCSKGVIPGLDRWLEVHALSRELHKDLDLKLLPRLARYLRDRFEVDPSDQDISPIENFLLWKPFFKPNKIARVLVDAFFPKWLTTLHMWLVSNPNYEEVGQWFSWWQKDVFPEDINAVPDIAAEWDKGLALMNQALDMGPELVKTELPPPVTAHFSSRAMAQELAAAEEAKARAVEEQKKAARTDDTATFKDILEDMCEQENLLMIPMRKAHPETGLPLVRITASASGVGGVQVYIKGDVVWAQDRKDRSLWEPVDLSEIVTRAEGK